MTICKLCNLPKKLIKAHIIPEFMYQDLYNEDHRFYEFSVSDIMDGKKLKPFAQIGEFDKNILCSECDNEKLGSLEKYAQKILFGSNLKPAETPLCQNYELGEFEFSECKDVDYNKFKMFLLSILWRSHITTRPMFDFVNLGPHADKIRNLLLHGCAGDELEYPIMVTSFIRADYHYKDLILKPRVMKCKDGIRSYVYSIGSFQFHFYVNSASHKLPEFVKEFTLKKDNYLKTIHLKDGMENLLIIKLTQ